MMLWLSFSSVPFVAIISSLRSRSRRNAVVNAIERCGKPDMVFHAVLRYPSVRETDWIIGSCLATVHRLDAVGR